MPNKSNKNKSFLEEISKRKVVKEHHLASLRMNLDENTLSFDVLSSFVNPVTLFLQQGFGYETMVKKYDYAIL